MKRAYSFFTLAALMLLTACAAIQKPQSFEEGLAYAYGTHAAVQDSAASALEVGSLSVDDAKQVLKLADEARALLDASRLASGAGDIHTAEGQLALATNILTQLQIYLRERKS